MIRSIAAALLLLGGAYGLTSFMVGYSRAGSEYVAVQREARKSLRPGSIGRVRTGGSGGFRTGK